MSVSVLAMLELG